MSLIKAEIWLRTHPLFLWTDIINYTSFHRGSGFAYNIGLHWEPDDMFASNKLCLLISIQPFSTAVCWYIHVHPALWPQIPEQSRSAQSSQRWSSCSPCVARELWLLGARPQGTQAGTRNVREAKGCGHDVTAWRGRSEALPTKYWRHMAKNDLQEVSIILCYWSV